MHFCPNCDQPCHCNGDIDTDIEQPEGDCTHCLGDDAAADIQEPELVTA